MQGGMDSVDDDECLMKFKTVQANGLQKLIECMKEILTDVNWEFDPNYVKVMCMDGNHVSLVNVRLDSENFEYYKCVNKIKVGINMTNLAKLLKTVGNNDAITMFISVKNPNDLGIIIENTDKSSTTLLNLKLLDIDIEDITIPDHKPDTVVTMSSSELQKIFRDLILVNDLLYVEATSKYIKFKCSGDFGTRETMINASSLGTTQLMHDTDDQKVSGTYSLKYLNLFTKGSTNMCSVVEIMLKNQYPIFIKYSVASLGYITFCLAPKAEED